MTSAAAVRKASEPRKPRRQKSEREVEVQKAMKLYFKDNDAARKVGTGYPKIADYVTEAGGVQMATDYAKSRFAELE
jgi:hypothetical protein